MMTFLTGKARDHALIVASTLFAFGAGILVLGLTVPRLFGVSPDLKVVQLDTKVPAFFDNVFRPEDRAAKDYFVSDPVIRIRGRPFHPEVSGVGPHDVLGFRNPAVPHVTDVLTIGDSMTYGTNVLLGSDWPSILRDRLAPLGATVYNMSAGGWGAVQYLDMFEKGLFFEPRVVIVAFYTGNDALDSFKDVYGLKRFADLRPDPRLTAEDMPQVRSPAPPEDWWIATFADSTSTTFAPQLRLSCNDRNSPAVRAGYAIMKEVARRLAASATERKVKLVLTILPTKELSFAPRVERDRLHVPPAYTAQLAAEKQNIAELEGAIRELGGVTYVDLVAPLQQLALTDASIYPASSNGHPLARGYQAIAEGLADVVAAELPVLPEGLHMLTAPKGNKIYYLNRDHQLWMFAGPQAMEGNGWSKRDAAKITYRDIAGIRLAGVISAADRVRFGPRR